MIIITVTEPEEVQLHLPSSGNSAIINNALTMSAQCLPMFSVPHYRSSSTSGNYHPYPDIRADYNHARFG